MSNLLKLYEYYFTGTDVKVFLSDPITGKSVYVDLLNGIGYDYNLSSIPVYTLGTGTPTFFSKGNSLGQGMMVVPFKDTELPIYIGLSNVDGLLQVIACAESVP